MLKWVWLDVVTHGLIGSHREIDLYFCATSEGQPIDGLNARGMRKTWYLPLFVPPIKDSYCQIRRGRGSSIGRARFVCLVSYSPRSQLGYIADGSQDLRLTILRVATHETEWGDHDFCLSRSHYTDTDPTSGHSARLLVKRSWIRFVL